MYLSVLNTRQINLLKELKFLNEYGFYLAGGTALALQINHRTSIDFDFYTEKDFDNRKLLGEIEEQFNDVKVVQIPEQTLITKIKGIEVNFFRYPYPLIYPLIIEKEFPRLARQRRCCRYENYGNYSTRNKKIFY